MLFRYCKPVIVCVVLTIVAAWGGVSAQEYDPSEWFEPRDEPGEETHRPASPRDRAIQLAEIAEAEEADDDAYQRVFSSSLLRRMPVDEVHPVLRRYINRYGSVEEVYVRAMQTEYAAHLEFLLRDGVLVPVSIGLSRDDARLIDSIWIGQAVTVDSALQSVAEELSAFAGELRVLALPLGREPGADNSAVTERELSLGADEETELGELAARAEISDVLRAVREELLGWDDVLRPQASHGAESTALGAARAPITVYTATLQAFVDPRSPAQAALSEALSEVLPGAERNDTLVSLKRLADRYRAIVQAEDEDGAFARGILLANAQPFPPSVETNRSALVVLSEDEYSGSYDDNRENRSRDEHARVERGYLLRSPEGWWFFVGAVWSDRLERPRTPELDRRLQRLLELLASTAA